MRIATKDEYIERNDTTLVVADLSNGIPERTFVQVDNRNWEEAKPFVKGYWAGIDAAKSTAKNTRQLNKMFKHAANYGMSPEQFSKSQAFAEKKRGDKECG
jgi:hypothetical protein